MKYYTSVPNFLFDKYLPKLKPSEFMILMFIARQTFGWYDTKRRTHKKRDWISHRLFIEKTNLSHKTISVVIDSLTQQNIIRTSNAQDIKLEKEDRKLAHKVYYEIIEESFSSNLMKVTDQAKQQVVFQTDAERIADILARKKFPNRSENE